MSIPQTHATSPAIPHPALSMEKDNKISISLELKKRIVRALMQSKEHIMHLETVLGEIESHPSLSASRGKRAGRHKARHKQPPHSFPKKGASSASPPVLMLSDVITRFLVAEKKRNRTEKYRIHQNALSLFLSIHGDCPVFDIRQARIHECMDIVQNLPPKWMRLQKRTGKDCRALSHENQGICISKRTFDNNYKSSLSIFLAWATHMHGDEGFPGTLSAKRIEYTGNRTDPEHKQRPFMHHELKRLFEGSEMRAFSRNTEKAHQFWLPHIGLFTGARVNEICQINPQTDVLEEDGVPYFWLTTETPADDGIKKSIKTRKSRKVPVHRQLIALGLLDYIRWLKQNGHRRLFPAWRLVQGRNAASLNAIRWFGRLLEQTGIKTEGKNTIRGMHAFRHTLLTYGKKQGLNLATITGHEEDNTSAVIRGYICEDMVFSIADKKKLIDKLAFDLRFFRPARHPK